MKYETKYKNCKIIVEPAVDDIGYEAKVTPKGCKTATSWNNYENATQALSFAKEQIDLDEVPKERQKFLGLF